MGFFSRLFNLQSKAKDRTSIAAKFSDEEYESHFINKDAAIEGLIGKMHHMVGHAIIPYDIGGTVDMYYFPNYIEGTGFATMELIRPDGTGPKPNTLGTYEFVAFTRELIPETDSPETKFNLIERRFCGIFTTLGNYSTEAVLKPGDTCEVPGDDTDDDTTCIIFDHFPKEQFFKIDDHTHHLLLCMEVFRSEMEFAMENGSQALFEKLKAAHIYPYSDMDREAVV